ncbi:MAG: hypothetical protein KDJ16_04370 [Hyphomicrobiales bacterium]|nr:hypothetical protein [Hyphomicrobiales bacterium]
MPLQNRVWPNGEIRAHAARGLFMGNRGGRLHDGEKRLGHRRWVSKSWIVCRTAFKDRHREVMGDGYTELFFLDEVTALAAGHRPCFECRRREADAFAEAWCRAEAATAPPRAAEMDRRLHAERLSAREKRLHAFPIDDMPDGAMIEIDGATFAVHSDALLRWSPGGYSAAGPRPNGCEVAVLTPPAVLSVLAAGYPPVWHDSAIALTGRSR